MSSFVLFLSLLLALIYILQQCEAKERVYYIAAIDVNWDYAPTGYNLKNGKSVDLDEYVLNCL